MKDVIAEAVVDPKPRVGRKGVEEWTQGRHELSSLSLDQDTEQTWEGVPEFRF